MRFLPIDAQLFSRVKLTVGQMAPGMKPAERRFGQVNGDASHAPAVRPAFDPFFSVLRVRTFCQHAGVGIGLVRFGYTFRHIVS